MTCSGTHGGGTPAKSDPWIHQRMAWMELGMVPVNYFAALAGDPTPVPEQEAFSLRYLGMKRILLPPIIYRCINTIMRQESAGRGAVWLL